MAQAGQRGYTGRHTFWPHVTRYKLMYGHQRGSVALYNACSVSSGVFVFTQPSRFAMRWTCVSTQMFFWLSYARIRTRFAVFRPTPGSVRSYYIVEGVLPPKSFFSLENVALMYRAF